MSFLRARQRVMTGLFPHQANRTHVIPSRGPGPFVTEAIFKTTLLTLVFNRNIQGGDELGFAYEVNGVPVIITTALNAAPDTLELTHAGGPVLGDVGVIKYKRTAWTGDVYPAGTDFVRGFSRQGIISP